MALLDEDAVSRQVSHRSQSLPNTRGLGTSLDVCWSVSSLATIERLCAASLKRATHKLHCLSVLSSAGTHNGKMCAHELTINRIVVCVSLWCTRHRAYWVNFCNTLLVQFLCLVTTRVSSVPLLSLETRPRKLNFFKIALFYSDIRLERASSFVFLLFVYRRPSCSDCCFN